MKRKAFFLTLLFVTILSIFHVNSCLPGSKQKQNMFAIRLNECIQLLAPNSLDQAIQCTNLLALDFPDEANAINYRGIAYYMKQEYDLALKDFNKAISMDKKDPVLYFNRSAVFFAYGKY